MDPDNSPEQEQQEPVLPLEPSVGQYTELNFTVDAALLQELGERLVGKPFTALAELVKNSYDADAEQVVIRFDDDVIEVTDNGHGMDFEAFVTRWMRVGSPHKRKEERSPEKGRPLTGSKGVGRLAAQFLSSGLQVISTSCVDESKHLEVDIDWTEIPAARDLQDVHARLKIQAGSDEYPDGSPHGTRIVMRGLRQRWDADSLRDLAKELWFLQPPEGVGGDFKVDVETADPSLMESFDKQMRAILEVWEARLLGAVRARGGERFVEVMLEFKDGPSVKAEFKQAVNEDGKVLFKVDDLPDSMKFDIRVYHLRYRQPQGLTVKDAQVYMREYGGVHVYDAGFRLPHYGADTDWLDIEQDHAHRLSASKLLPKALQVQDGLNFLPTNSRILGAVFVNTSHEAGRNIPEPLGIAITRDRLTENSAYRALQNAVRWAIDFYAMQTAKRRVKEADQAAANVKALDSLDSLGNTLNGLKAQIPEPAFRWLQRSVKKATNDVRAEQERHTAQTSLMATLATAGMAALAYEHETSKQLAALEALAGDIKKVNPTGLNHQKRLSELGDSILEWIQRTRDLRGLFGHLMDERNRENRGNLRVYTTVDIIIRQLAPLLRGIPIDRSEIARDLRFPAASLAEWTAIFQNVLVNSVNAMLDSTERGIRIWSRRTAARARLLIEDKGVGVDPAGSEILFQPFERRLDLSPERRNLGLGGTGIGLTIVRVIGEKIGCNVRFVEPSAGFSACVEISWSTDE